MTNPARTRIGRVTLKGGAQLVVLSPRVSPTRRDIERQLRSTLDHHGDDLAGFALVVWAADCTSTASLGTAPESTIPTTLIPDFVRARLEAEDIKNWVVRIFNGES